MNIRKRLCSGRTTSKILNWSKYLAFSSLVATGLSACQESEPVSDSPSTDYWTKKYAGGVIHDETGYYQDSRLIVNIPIYRWDNEAEKVQNIANAVNAKISGWNKKENAYLFDVPKASLDEAINSLNKIPEIEAYRNYYYLSYGYDNEVLLNGAKSLDLPAQIKAYLSWWHKSINLSKGLDLLTGRSMMLTTIAILDSGFDLSDPEIPFAQRGTFNLVDQTLIGPDNHDAKITWNFGDMNGNVLYTNPNFSHGHEVAQFAAGINNGQRANGVASIGNKTFQLLPIKIVSENEAVQFNLDRINETKGDQFQLSQALDHLADIADEVNLGVVNISYGYSRNFYAKNNPAVKPGKLVGSAIQRLHDKGVIVVAANGNDDADACNNIPSSLDNVVAVGGTGLKHTFENGIPMSNEEKRFYWEVPAFPGAGSNFSDNEKCLTIAAPAQDLLTFYGAGNSYDRGPVPFALGEAGTSFSSPMVAGAIALLKARAYPVLRPDSYSSVKTYLRQTAKDLVLSGEINHAELNGKIWKTLDVGNLVAFMESKIPKVEGISEAFHLGTFDWERPLADYGYIGDHNKVFDFNILPNTIVPRVIKKQAEKYPELDESIIGLDNGTVAYVREVYDNMQNRTKEYFLTDLRDGKTTPIKKPDNIEPKQVLYRNGKIIWNLSDRYLVTDKDGKEIYNIPTDQAIYETDGETFLFTDKIFRNGQLRDMPTEILASKGYLFREGVALIWDDKSISRYDLDSGKIEKLVDESTPVVYDLDRDNLLYAIYKDGQSTVKIFNWHTKTYARTMLFGKESLVVPTQIRGNLLIATSRTDMNLKTDLYAYIWK